MNSKLLFINIFRFFRLAWSYQLKLRACLIPVVLALYCFPQNLYAQSAVGSMMMGPVLVDSLRISGNFGELRGNHFHSGIDYKTNEKEGKPVLAAAAGYVSRVKVSAGGYGKAVYISHPNSVVTVYAHLRVFYPALEDTIRNLQEVSRDYEVEIFPDSGAFPIHMGKVIGFSGNTGSSEGPHLHFETRHSGSEKPFNPELAGYTIYDTIPPQLLQFAIYRPGPAGGLAGSEKQLINPSIPGIADSIFITGPLIFTGFESLDQSGNESNHLDIRAYSLYLDDSLLLTTRIDSFSFDETRMINAAIDYAYYLETGRRIRLCHLLKGNRLSFMTDDQGMIYLEDTLKHTLKIRIEDTAGNMTEFSMIIRQGPHKNSISDKPKGTTWLYGESKKITENNYRIELSKTSFYEDVVLLHSAKLKNLKNVTLLSPVVTIGPLGAAVHDAVSVSIKTDTKKMYDLSRLVVVKIDSTGNLQGIRCTFDKGWVHFKTRTLGSFSVVEDTVPISIKNQYWEPDDYSGKHKLIIELSNDLSGYASTKCFLQDNWVPAVYQARKNRLIFYPEIIPETADNLDVKLEISDSAGNSGIYEFQVAVFSQE